VALRHAVEVELSNSVTPSAVREWIAGPPSWLEIYDTRSLGQLPGLDAGEAAAIALAEELRADMLLIDEPDGARVARSRGLRVTGTLGLLDLAAERGWVDFVQSVEALKSTTFRRPNALLEFLLAKHRRSENG